MIYLEVNERSYVSVVCFDEESRFMSNGLANRIVFVTAIVFTCLTVTIFNSLQFWVSWTLSNSSFYIV